MLSADHTDVRNRMFCLPIHFFDDQRSMEPDITIFMTSDVPS